MDGQAVQNSTHQRGVRISDVKNTKDILYIQQKSPISLSSLI